MSAARASAWTAARALLPARADYAAVRTTWRGDLLAGLTVGIVALPLALAFGESSGVGAAAGIVTAIVAGFVAAVFGGSNIQVSGPTGAMVVILGPIVASHGVAAVAAVSVLAGIVVVIAGVLRLGRLVAIIPWPVIEGFTLGIAVIIFLQQVPSALGLTAADGAPVHSANALVAAVQSFGEVDPARALWSLGTVAAVVVIMVVLPRVHRAIPSAIVAIIVVSIIATAIGAPLDRIGALPTGLPAPTFPAIDPGMLVSLAGPVFAVAALAAIESLLSARVGAAIADVGRFDADRELVGQGLASVASGMFGGMPATGAIARTAVNVRSGGRTRLAAITHAIVLLVVVLVAGAVVGQIPLAALAGVLMVTAVRMVTLSTVRAVVTASRADALVFTTTAVVTVAFDLIIAVGIGVVVAAVFALRSLARSASVRREPLPGPAQPGDERIALVTIDGAMFFGAAEAVAEQVADVEPAAGGPIGAEGIVVVIVRMSQVRSLDATGARVITELVTTLERRGVTVLLKGIRPEHLELARRVGVVASLRHHRHLFDSLEDAVEHARDHVRRDGATAVR